MELDEVIAKRRSVRQYNSHKQVSKEDVIKIIQAAQQAPSWKNSQTGRYYAIFGEKKLATVRDCLVPQNQRVSQDVSVLLVTSYKKDISGFTNEGRAENELGNGWGSYDLGLQAGYLVLKAADMGIDSIILGLRDADKLREVLEIAQDEIIVSVIALGYRSQGEITAPKRKEITEILKIVE